MSFRWSGIDNIMKIDDSKSHINVLMMMNSLDSDLMHTCAMGWVYANVEIDENYLISCGHSQIMCFINYLTLLYFLCLYDENFSDTKQTDKVS